jgi:hypothetical protein
MENVFPCDTWSATFTPLFLAFILLSAGRLTIFDFAHHSLVHR